MTIEFYLQHPPSIVLVIILTIKWIVECNEEIFVWHKALDMSLTLARSPESKSRSFLVKVSWCSVFVSKVTCYRVVQSVCCISGVPWKMQKHHLHETAAEKEEQIVGSPSSSAVMPPCRFDAITSKTGIWCTKQAVEPPQITQKQAQIDQGIKLGDCGLFHNSKIIKTNHQ